LQDTQQIGYNEDSHQGTHTFKYAHKCGIIKREVELAFCDHVQSQRTSDTYRTHTEVSLGTWKAH